MKIDRSKVRLLLLASVSCLFMTIQCNGQLYSNSATAWNVGQDLEEYGSIIQRLEGQNEKSGVTNIAYESPNKMKNDVKKRAEKLMWTEDKLNEEIGNIDKFAPGGVIDLYATRATIQAANSGNFILIIQDTTGKELIRKSFPQEPPLGQDGELYYTISISTLNKKIEAPFFVFIIDNYLEKKFKFLVKKII